MITQNEALLVDYVNKITAFLSVIQVACAKNSSSVKSGDRLSWDEILIHLDKNPLPTLKDHFPNNYDSLLRNNSQASLSEIDNTIASLNQVTDYDTWKQGINYLLKLLKGKSYEPFYHGEDYRPENFVL